MMPIIWREFLLHPKSRVEISGNIYPEILESELISRAASLHSQQAGAAQWHRIHYTGQCTVGIVTWVQWHSRNMYMILGAFLAK